MERVVISEYFFTYFHIFSTKFWHNFRLTIELIPAEQTILRNVKFSRWHLSLLPYCNRINKDSFVDETKFTHKVNLVKSRDVKSWVSEHFKNIIKNGQVYYFKRPKWRNFEIHTRVKHLWFERRTFCFPLTFSLVFDKVLSILITDSR